MTEGKPPSGFVFIDQADAVAVVCTVCGRRWNARRIGDARNVAYLEEHFGAHAAMVNKALDPKAERAKRTAVKIARGERLARQLLARSTSADHANGTN